MARSLSALKIRSMFVMNAGTRIRTFIRVDSDGTMYVRIGLDGESTLYLMVWKDRGGILEPCSLEFNELNELVQWAVESGLTS